MKRLFVGLLLIVGLVLPAQGHTYLSHDGCTLHGTYKYDGYVGGAYWYHVGTESGDDTRNWHYRQFPGDPRDYVHSSYSYNCR